jgi:drug/metabolite transporter (DMT)-like permease
VTVATTTTPQPSRPAGARRQALILVACCTILGAAGQILIKMGANSLTHTNPLAMLTNLPLLAGYSLYGLMTVLFIFALRHEELSIVYPIISLNYVWVAGLSVLIFHEPMNLSRGIGVGIIVLGVCVLGRDAQR